MKLFTYFTSKIQILNKSTNKFANPLYVKLQKIKVKKKKTLCEIKLNLV